MTRYLLAAMAWLTCGVCPFEQQPRTASTLPGNVTKGEAFSGQVVDGLGRPVPGAKITVRYTSEGQSKRLETALLTDDGGRFSGAVPTDDSAMLVFEKEGYGHWRTDARSGATIILRRKWDGRRILRFSRGEELVNGVRAALASDEWAHDDHGLLGFLLDAHEELRPALRELVTDPHVGASARDWLDLLGDPRDHDIFPKGRRYIPKKPVKEPDLVEALKATALARNFNTSAPRPWIDIDFIAFTQDLDGVLVQCGINRAAMTGITWQFVFWRLDKQWELRSAKEAGRS
jgi:hypothetical protein